MNSIDSLRQKYLAMVGPFKVHQSYKSLYTKPQHDGSPHIESDDRGFSYVVTERGAELRRISGLSEDEVLYLLMASVTMQVATAHELSVRKTGVDSRCVWFPYQENLMHELRPEWGDRLRAEHADILKLHPFT